MTEEQPGKHRLQETPVADGGTHRAAGEREEPITVKRKPGVNMAKPLVNETAAEKYRNRTKGIR